MWDVCLSKYNHLKVDDTVNLRDNLPKQARLLHGDCYINPSKEELVYSMCYGVIHLKC